MASAAIYREGEGLRELSNDPALGLVAAVAALPDGAALLAGGRGSAGATAVAWRLVDGATLRPAGAMLAARSAHTLSVVGGAGFAAGFAIGGRGADGQPRDDIEPYNPGARSPPTRFAPWPRAWRQRAPATPQPSCRPAGIA